MITHVKDIHNESELNKFMAEKNQIRDPFDNAQYRFYLIPDYKEVESVFVMKSHHCLTDGLGTSSMFLALSDNYDKTALPSLKPVSFCKKVVINLCMPYLYLKGVMNMVLKL